MANSAIQAASDKNYEQIIDNFHITHQRVAHQHKSLDFSNIGVFGGGPDARSINISGSDSEFRHFHQLRLFIETGNMIKHGAADNTTTIITANLPERIQYSLNSKWSAPLSFFDATTNLLFQMVGKEVTNGNVRSGVPRISGFKIWTGTDPLTLDLTIPVIDDGSDGSGTNLVEALEVLGSLCLPSYNPDEWGFYNPPPSPLNLKIKYTKPLDVSTPGGPEADEVNLATNYSRIMLQLGGILLVDKCIIENLTVTYPNTKAQIMHDYSVSPEYFGRTGVKYLHPLLAEVHLRISTIEAMTSDVYSKMLWAKPQSNQGEGTADVSPVTNLINKAARWATANDENPQPMINEDGTPVAPKIKE